VIPEGDVAVGTSVSNAPSPRQEPARRRNVYRRRQEILDAAARIIFEKGYEATTTQDIADAVGLLKGSLYYYIDSKEDLLFEIIRESHEGALAALDRVRQAQGDALARLELLIKAHVDHFAKNLTKATVFFREARLLSEDRRAVITEEGDAYLDFLRELLREGQAAGTIPRDLDVPLVAIGITGMLNSMSIWYHPDGRLTADQIGEEFARLVIHGVVGTTSTG
jgi:AcrR family transcriptional regulator